MSRLARIRSALLAVADRRPPDFVIGGQDNPYLRRWWLLPRNPFFNVYLHEFRRSDDDRALHDHPWLLNASWLLAGAYREHTILAGGIAQAHDMEAGDFKFRWGAAPHRIELFEELFSHEFEPCWTLFITGPRVREWGFYCMERGWVHWKRFTARTDKGAIGAGCEG